MVQYGSGDVGGTTGDPKTRRRRAQVVRRWAVFPLSEDTALAVPVTVQGTVDEALCRKARSSAAASGTTYGAGRPDSH